LDDDVRRRLRENSVGAGRMKRPSPEPDLRKIGEEEQLRKASKRSKGTDGT
jgi:hypothetical protein